MKYCLSIGLHNLYFDIAIINNKHEMIGKKRCLYDRSKDISNNIYSAYKKNFNKYHINGVGVALSNNINFKDDVLYSIKAFNLNRYDLKKALVKQFKVEVFMIEETYAASLGVYSSLECKSLLYVIVDNRISNSFVVDGELLMLEDDINLAIDENLNRKCGKDNLKKIFLSKGFDDEYIGGYCISKDPSVNKIIQEWAKELNSNLEKVVKTLKVEKIVFAGYMGEYFKYYSGNMNIVNKITCSCINNHSIQALIGISHLIFKDKH